jgi:3-methyladenine DNA glycosylase AlkD
LKSSAGRSSPTSIKPDPKGIAREIERALRKAGNPARADAEKRYLKSNLNFLGVGLPEMRLVVRRIGKKYPGLDRRLVLPLVQALWAEPVHECRMVAIDLLRLHRELLRPADLQLVERMIRDSLTWAYVDELAYAVAGRLVERFPKLLASLDRWSTDADFWVRRSALLALLPELRRGGGDFERLSRYADLMLPEQEFFIRKAIGWAMRETGKKQPALVYEWLLPRIGRASGVTVREAVRWLLPEQRAACLAAYRSATGRTLTSEHEPQ